MKIAYVGTIEQWIHAITFSFFVSIPVAFAANIEWQIAICYVLSLMSTIIFAIRIAIEKHYS